MQRSAFARMAGVLLAGVGCVGCGDGGATVDASIVVDIDNGSCGDELRFTGEYVDWDNEAGFCGIGSATVEVDGDGAMDTTAPNGRFDLCIPRTSATTRLGVTQPTGMSPCATPASIYTVPVILHASRDVILAGGLFSARAFTAARQMSLFTGALPFDATKAHVVVYVNGTPRAVSLAATHATTQAVIGTTWAPGATGRVVFFPNVDVGSGTTMLSVAGGAIGTGTIPLAAGTITNVSVVAP